MQCPACPQCRSKYTYVDRGFHICPACAHVWDNLITDETPLLQVRDANGNQLVDGDTVILIRDLKVKGSSSVIKIGT